MNLATDSSAAWPASPASPSQVAAEDAPHEAVVNAPAGASGRGSLRVRLIHELSFTERVVGGRRTYVCHHHQKGQFFHFGRSEYEAARLLDGTRGAAEVARELTRQGVPWTAGDAARLIEMLLRGGLARVIDAPERPSLAASSAAVGDSGSSMSSPAAAGAGGLKAGSTGVPRPVARCLSGLLSQRINLLDGDRLAARWVRLLGPLFSPGGVAVWLAVVLSGMAIVAVHTAEFTIELRRLFSPQSWPLMVAIWGCIKIAHELGHAVAAKRQGVRVGRAGIILFLMAPLAFVDVTDAWRLPRRWSRVQIALAGMYVELGIAALAAWYWWSSGGEFTRHLAAQIFLLAGPATLLVNANPLLRLDGYYVLADVLDIPNLRMHGRQRLLAKFESWLLGSTCPAGLLCGWRATVTSIHAVCSLAFQVVWMGGLVISISLWAGGAGILLGVMAAVLWGVLPVWGWAQRIRQDEAWPAARRRLSLLLAAAGVTVGLLSALPSPLGRRVPVVVQYHDEQVARAATDGFVVAVPVRTGQRVEAGDVLIVMEDPELQMRKEQLALDAEAARLRARRLSRDGQRALASAEQDRYLGLLRSLEELERQLASLRICARRDGIVCSRNPERWLGRFARRGDLLLCVGEEHAKELMASIDGSDLEAYLQAVAAGQSCQVRLRGGRQFAVVPTAPRPRVRQSIPHPALAATAGGPLPVEPQAEAAASDQFRLIAPRSESCSPLDHQISRALRSGQQGMLVIGDSRSLISRALAPLQQVLAGGP